MNTSKNQSLTAAPTHWLQALPALKPFLGRSQHATIASLMMGEEGQFFRDKVVELGKLIATMPRTYDQDGKGQQATAYLHYFKGGADWYITELDKGSPDDLPDSFQSQAYGQANLGYGPETGYISIPELLRAGVELDFHFTPQTLAQLNKK
jgi:hypothetical protein